MRRLEADPEPARLDLRRAVHRHAHHAGTPHRRQSLDESGVNIDTEVSALPVRARMVEVNRDLCLGIIVLDSCPFAHIACAA